jgi:hypothetical protein
MGVFSQTRHGVLSFQQLGKLQWRWQGANIGLHTGDLAFFLNLPLTCCVTFDTTLNLSGLQPLAIKWGN